MPIRTARVVGEQTFWEDVTGTRTVIPSRQYDDWGSGKRTINGAVRGARALLFDTVSGRAEYDVVHVVASQNLYVVSEARVIEVPADYQTATVRVTDDIILEAGEVVKTTR